MQQIDWRSQPEKMRAELSAVYMAEKNNNLPDICRKSDYLGQLNYACIQYGQMSTQDQSQYHDMMNFIIDNYLNY